MKKTLVALTIAAALPALAQAPAKAPAKATAKAINTATVTLVGTIDAIDSTARAVTVKIDGEYHTFTVKPDVKRFSELKVGDKLTAEYTESTAYEVRKAGAAAPAAAGGGDTVRVAGKAVRPSGTIVQQAVATVLVKAIDAKTPTITVETDDKRVVTMKVDRPERLAAVKVGDKIDVTYTRVFTVRIN